MNEKRKSRKTVPKIPISLNNSNISAKNSKKVDIDLFEKIREISFNHTTKFENEIQGEKIKNKTSVIAPSAEKRRYSKNVRRSRNLMESARNNRKSSSKKNREENSKNNDVQTNLLYSHIREKISQLSPNKPQSEVEYPINPSKALKLFLDKLTDYEKGEILDYKNIYFVGVNADKTLYNKFGQNHGFDDDRADYICVNNDHIAYRYEILAVLGKGSFGQALRCFDHKKKEQVALKIIRNKKRFHRQAVIEAKILKFIKEHGSCDKNSIVKMHEFFIFRSHFVFFI